MLGAGASLAAFPSGEGSGKRLPLMKDLVSTCGLDRVLKAAGITEGLDDFEALYSRLKEDPTQGALVAEVENMIDRYFESLTMPPEPTIYDLLILSLRAKDVIATFNWDPFLSQARRRTDHIHRGQAPKLLFLHGNVEVWYCPRCSDRVRLGSPHEACSRCDGPMEPTPLLYPLKEKKYTSDRPIRAFWNSLREALHSAYFWTIYGYSAPKSDEGAIALLKGGWGEGEQREYEQVEIVNISPRSDLIDTWVDFLCGEHFDCHSDIFNSWLFRNPRRSCEALYSETIDMVSPIVKPLARGLGWSELAELLKPLIDTELADS